MSSLRSGESILETIRVCLIPGLQWFAMGINYIETNLFGTLQEVFTYGFLTNMIFVDNCDRHLKPQEENTHTENSGRKNKWNTKTKQVTGYIYIYFFSHKSGVHFNLPKPSYRYLLTLCNLSQIVLTLVMWSPALGCIETFNIDILHYSAKHVGFHQHPQHIHQQGMGVSKNRGTPKWMVYNGTPY